jgi:hypothetical protein
MNDLHEYGIMQEDSDTRAHVCPVVKRVYVFDTATACRIIREGDYRVASATQQGVNGDTARGWLVPPGDLPGCAEIRPRELVWEALNFSPQEPTSMRGREAVRLVVGMIKNGMFPLPAHPSSDLSLDVDLAGTDIKATVHAQTLKIQVKCDREGGRKKLGGTGNLYLQKSERNPHGLHDGDQSISVP